MIKIPSQATLLAGKNTRFGNLLYENADFLAIHQPNETDLENSLSSKKYKKKKLLIKIYFLFYTRDKIL
jgi:hypothetical protein